jgi:Tn3 transposase DDE domain
MTFYCLGANVQPDLQYLVNPGGYGGATNQVVFGVQLNVPLDGQFFRAGGRGEVGGLVNLHYGQDPGVKFYTHLSDQFGPYHTKVIAATAMSVSTRASNKTPPPGRIL